MPARDPRTQHPFTDLPLAQDAWQRGLAVLKPSDTQLEQGLALHQQSLVIDHFGFKPGTWPPHVSALWNELKAGQIGALELEERMLTVRIAGAAYDRNAAREFTAALTASGLKCLVHNVAEGKSRAADIKLMAAYRQLCRVFRHRLVQAGSAPEIRQAAQQGLMATVWSVNGPPLAGELKYLDEEMGWIETWYNLGVRLMHMSYNRRNMAADGCAEPANGGLSALGQDLVRKLNETGIIVDTPHTGIQSTLDAAAAASKPIMASHTGARGLFDHMRCKSDEEIKAIAATGGMCAVYALPNMLGPQADLNTMLDHVDYIAKLVGVEHVGIGTDSSYHAAWPAGLERYPQARFTPRWWGNWQPDNHPLPPSDEASHGSLCWTNWPLYTVGLIMRGYADADIRKIQGENFLRILEATRPESEVRLADG